MAQAEAKTESTYRNFLFGEAMAYLQTNPGKILRVEGEVNAGMANLKYEESTQEYYYSNESEPTHWNKVGNYVQYLTAKTVIFTDQPPVTLGADWEPIIVPFGQYGKAIRRMVARLVKRIETLDSLAVSLQAQLDTLTPKKRKGKADAEIASTSEDTEPVSAPASEETVSIQ